MEKISYWFIIILLVIFYSCKKEYDSPPLKNASDGNRITIKKLKERVSPFQSNAYQFKSGDTNLYCTVISDELSGNFYQQVFVSDEFGGAIQLNLKESGGLSIGDKIRINLNSVYLVFANGMIYLDSIDVAKSVVKLSSGNLVIPKTVSVAELVSYSVSPTHSASLQSQLVKINDVEFRTNMLIPTFADAIGKTTTNQTITTCGIGEVITVRTSGRSNFAGKPLPKGNGSIIAIVSQYNSTIQLTLRDYSEVNMNAPLCAAPSTTVAMGTFMYKDFNDMNIVSGGWTTYTLSNASVVWQIGTSSLTTSPYAKISGFVSGNTNSETWLISPIINLSNAKAPVLNFKSAAKFSGTALEVLISTNYQSGAPSSATWTNLSGYLLSPTTGDYVWTNSGYVSLSAYKSATTCIAFKYKSTLTGASSYQLDDIVVKEK